MTRDRISALFFLAVSIAYGILAQDIRLPVFAAEFFTARTLPTGLAALGAGISLLMLALPAAPDTDMRATVAGWRGFAWGRIVLLGTDMLIYGYLLTRIGFIASTTLFLVAGFAILGERRPALLIGASLPVVVVFWAILNQLLGIYLGPPLGAWGLALTRSGAAAAGGG